MPIPIILGVAAAAAAAAGVGAGARGAMKMKKAKNIMEEANSRHNKNLSRFEEQNKKTTHDMDTLGKKELEILSSFEKFSEAIEKIQNKPSFKKINNEQDVNKYKSEELKRVSIGAGVLLGGIGGAAAGTAGGFAAAGATTSAVMALGTASTGTAISSLSGVAATNATLAALGGGSIAAGGGGMALGSTILGASTLGVGILVGGIIFNIVGSSLSNKADEAMNEAIKAENEINKVCDYLVQLSKISQNFYKSLEKIQVVYDQYLANLIEITSHKIDWNDFNEEEKVITHNTVLLVGVLYNMCKVKFVINKENECSINYEEINKTLASSDKNLLESGMIVA